MPELPEVETIRRDLQFAVIGKEIRNVKVHTGRCLEGDPGQFISILKGNTITAIQRRGKLLIFTLGDKKSTLLIHLKMTGQLICQIPGGIIIGGHPSAKIENLPNNYTHFTITFGDYSELHFNDVRTFGYAKIVNQAELDSIVSKFGLEPLSEGFTKKKFLQIFEKRKTSVKSLLLNQQVIAGIGNIYADEICYRAKVHPARSVSDLTDAEKSRLYTACTKILEAAVAKRGTTFSNFVDAAGKKGGYLPFLKVYQKVGERCIRCGDDYIEKTVVAGRGTHFCRSCQK